ncbi:unnamed protein product, partial [Ascophyllum nodosum]
ETAEATTKAIDGGHEEELEAARAQQQCERLRKVQREKAAELLARLREKHHLDK